MTLLALPPELCPSCGLELTVDPVEQPALFKHGGYGATRRTVLRRCPGCGWQLLSEQGDVWP